jgi:hypothetical protein
VGGIDIGIAQEGADVRMWDVEDGKLVFIVCARDSLAGLIKAHRAHRAPANKVARRRENRH